MAVAVLQIAWSWSLQIAVLVAAAALWAAPLRWTDPRARVLLWQVVLTLAMLLPLSTILRSETSTEPVHPSASAAAVANRGSAASHPAVWTYAPVSVLLLAAGVLYRGGRILVTVASLRRLTACPALVVDGQHEIEQAVGARARVVVAAVQQPFTFGARRPVIVVPEGFDREAAVVRRAVLAHELVHVRRRDWLQATFEEACAAVCWFHPGVWYAVSELRLAREEAVDREAARLVGSRRAYVETLLAFASRSDVPLRRAVAFFRHRQLVRRIAALSREVSMSPRLLVASAVMTALLLATALRSAQAAFPVPGFDVFQQGTAGASTLERLAHQVPRDAPAPAKVHDVRPAYPEEVRRIVTSAVFSLRVVIEADGSVGEARILNRKVSGPDSAPDALAAAVTRLSTNTLAAVRQWRFEPPAKVPLAMTVTVSFVADPAAGPAPPPPPPPPPPPAPTQGDATITPPVPVHQPRPEFPADALRAGQRGVVLVGVTIGTDGTVRDARVLESPSVPAFDEAALQAARQWRFRPGTKNGQPVAVRTEIVFSFELRE